MTNNALLHKHNILQMGTNTCVHLCCVYTMQQDKICLVPIEKKAGMGLG